MRVMRAVVMAFVAGFFTCVLVMRVVVVLVLVVVFVLIMLGVFITVIVMALVIMGFEQGALAELQLYCAVGF